MAAPDASADCLVIGGGPAGLTAALYLARFRRKVLVLDGGESRAAWIPRSRNLPGFSQGVVGEDLLAELRRQARKFGADLALEPALELTRDGEGFRARTRSRSLAAPFVLLATGVEEAQPGLPGFEAAVRAGLVRVCPICDGFESQGLNVAVVGPGAHAAREALFLRNFTAGVRLFLTPGPAPDAARLTALSDLGVEVKSVEASALEVCADRPPRVAGRRFDAVYLAYGIRPRSGLAAALGAELDAEGRILVGSHQETRVAGLFAAGDIVRGLNQISVAAGEAAIAATAIHNRLPPNPAA